MPQGKDKSKKLDDAVDMTFPASDPLAAGKSTGTEALKRPLDREPPLITKEQIDAAEKGEGHSHRDGKQPSLDRHKKHHGLADEGLSPEESAQSTAVPDHAGLGRDGKK